MASRPATVTNMKSPLEDNAVLSHKYLALLEKWWNKVFSQTTFRHVRTNPLSCGPLRYDALVLGGAVFIEKRDTKPSSVDVSAVRDTSYTCKGAGSTPAHIFTKAQVTATVQEGTAHAIDNNLIGDNKYPHLNSLLGVPPLPSDCSDTSHISEYPIFEHTLFASDTTNAGPDRVFFSFKGLTATFCVVYTHTGASQSAFRGCPRT